MRRIAITLLLLTVMVPVLGFAEDTTDQDAARLENIRTLIAEQHSKRETKAVQAPVVDGNRTAISPFTIIQGLALCLGVFFVGVFIAKKVSGVKTPLRGRRIRVIERAPVGGKTALVLAEVDGREVLLSVGGDRVSFIDLPEKIEMHEEMDFVCQPDVQSSHSVL